MDFGAGGRRLRIGRAYIVLGTIFVLLLALTPEVAAKDVAGNNGTVKIHDGNEEAEPATQNDPHVGCDFHLHFMFGDDMQSGSWEIQSWPPTGDRSVVADGTYDTAGDGEDSVAVSLDSGHYKLFWDGDAGKNDKHKAFWVACDNGGGGGGGGGGDDGGNSG
jgi:hypothetical protein